MLTHLRRHWQDPLHRNGWLLMANSASGAAFGFVFWLVVARSASPQAVGAGAALISAFTLAALLGKFGLDAALVRWVPATGARERRTLLLAALGVSAALSCLVAAVLVTGRAVLGDDMPAFGWREGAFFVASAALVAAGWVYDAYFLSERRAGLSLARNLVFNGVKVAVPVVAAFALSPFGIAFAWALGVALSVALAALLARMLLARAPVGAGALPPRRDVVRYAGVNYVVNVSEWLPSLVLPLVVIAVLGAEANARFYVAWTLASVGFFASKAVAQSAFAEMSAAEAARPRILRRAAWHQAAVLAPFALVLVLFGGPLLAVFGSTYAAAWPLLAVLAVSTAFVGAVNLRLAVLKVDASGGGAAAWELVLLPLALLAAALVATPALLPRLGIVGAGVAWLGANAAAALWSVAGPMRPKEVQACPPRPSSS